MWWIGYCGEGKHGLDNLGVFENDGSVRRQHPLLLDPSPKAHPLHIPRGFALVEDDLYIASAWHGDSHVARYRRRGNRFRFVENVVTSRQVVAMVHPFDVALGDDGRVYISSQDTNTVIAIEPQTRRPVPVVQHLRESFPKSRFLPGTVVASAQGRLPDVGRVPPADVPAPLGLDVVLDVQGKPRHSVRGVVMHQKLLYVADEAGDMVKIFEVATGRLLARIRGKLMKRPVHLLLHRRTLFVGAAGSGSVLAYDIPKGPPHGKYKPRVVIDGKLHEPSGLAIGPEGDLCVAERFDQRVRRVCYLAGKLRTPLQALEG